MITYDDFLKLENFELAFNRLKYTPNNEYKFFYQQDYINFSMFLNYNLQQIIDDIKEEKYEPQAVNVYYTPKKNYLSRPMSLLNFIDLIIYQALTNVVIDLFRENFSYYENRITFANVLNKDPELSYYYQFQNWRLQWKNYKKTIVNNVNEGYVFLADFDIASYYDFIDQSILLERIKSEGEIDEKIVSLLEKCLKKWSLSVGDNGESKRCGIPQGPDCSGIFAEIYLRYIDEKIIKNTSESKYFRYADDIKIMAKNINDCKKGIALIDYYCKDICLIAQSSKIGITQLDKKTVNQYINTAGLNLSNITYEYNENSRELKTSTHNKLKKKVGLALTSGNCLYLDKTILKFAFYKLNKDDDIKGLILQHWEELYLTFDGPIYYLNKYYDHDNDVLQKINQVLLNDDVLFQYNKAIIYNKFSHLKFTEDIYKSIVDIQGQRFWIVKYYAIKWLMRVGQQELIEYIITEQNNYFIEREKLIGQMLQAKNDFIKRQILKRYSSRDNMLAITAFFLHPDYAAISKDDDISDYIANILNFDKSNYIIDYFKTEYKINKKLSHKFVSELKKDNGKYNEAVLDINNYKQLKDGKYSALALQYLDLFHNVIVDVVMDKSSSEYGTKIEEMKSLLPQAYFSFKLLHETRNQRTPAHYKDKYDNIRTIINKTELKKLLQRAKLEDAYTEICNYYN